MVKAYQQGRSLTEIADAYGCSLATVWRWVKRDEQGGSMKSLPRTPNGRPPRQTPDHIEELVCELWRGGLQNYSAIARKVTPIKYPEFGQGGSQGMEWRTVKAILERRGLLHD